MSTWKSKRGAEKRPPDLDDCIENIESLSGDKFKSTKNVGQLYVAAIGLVYHLRLDQETIFSIRRKRVKKDDEGHFPKPKEIPAMTAVLHNQSLFESLIWCLKSNSTDVFDSSSSSAASVSQMNALYTPGSRKRGLSVDKTEVVSNKIMKSAHGQSPLVGKQKKSFNYANKPQMNIKVLAATILYVTMEPLDHWPVPLIEAYAEDCFGPRSWVDDTACRLLVQNLTLIHSDDNNHVHEVKNDENHKQQLEADACKVAEFYRMEKEKRNNNKQSHHTKTLSSSSASTPRTSPTFSRVSIQNDNSLNDSDKIPIAPILTKKRSMSVESSESKNTRQLSNSNSKESKSYMESSHAETTARSLTLNNKAGDESDSGDEEEEEVAIATSFGRPSGVGNGDGSSDGNSSSSGEEEDVCFLDKKSFDEHQRSSNAAHNPLEESFTSSADIPPPGPKLTYPLQQQKLNFTEVRQRYFGHNLESSYQAISEKLSERLDIKSKHNSGLLQCLPSFTSIPSVRSIITANLEKWLQSPALSGLARTLFSITVNSMKNINPPLPADLDALDNILRMRLKANQLNAHVENITAVATKIPTVAVTKHIYGHILREILLSMDSRDSAFSDHLSMIHAVHDVLPGQLSASGIASSILDLLTNPPISFGDLSKSQLVRRIRKLIQAIATKFGSSFDAYKVLDAMLSYQVDPEYLWTIRDEENKARLMFQCVTLLVDLTVVMQRVQPGGKSVKIINPSENDIAIVRAKLIKARKLLLRWCCEDYAPLCPTSSSNQYRRSTPTNGSREKKKGDIVGAGPADYTSILDGLTERDFPDWVNVIRCMLFLENPDSPELRQFLAMNNTAVEDDPGWDDEAKRISFCCDFGADIDDAMMWVILDTTTKKENSAPNDIALLVLEHMFEGCKKDKKPSLLLQDAKLLYKLYELVEYIPSVRKEEVMSNDSNGDYCDKICAEKTNEESLSTFSIPRLGYPGMWWRVTGLALIMCGASPDTIGSVALEKFPTLKALIKMITSDRYRFPTVDADEAAREEQKKTEQMMRDEEAKITEILFAPTQKPKKKTKHKHKIDAGTEYERSRTSRRQQEKREQELKRQREKEVAEARVEASRRKKLLRAAQKSIMIWDPTKGPRKPPKESADLIFSLEELFDLPRVFRQKSTEPDFLLATIGSTTRGAIERAYDWLIPIISFFPETISRLPASASCFLLLRAYGTEGEERSQLQKLSAPLLEHVRDSLMGKFGEADAVRAFDLLLTDVASHNPDRRRCARRVLHNAIGKENVKGMDETFAGSNHAWAINLMHVEHTNSILGDAVKKLTLAASFERGSNLRYLVLALNKLTKLAKENSMPGDWDFASLLIELVSIRPTVFATALSSFPDLCSLAIHIVTEEFKVYFEGESVKIKSGDIMVCISLCSSPFENGGRVPTKVEMPITLLQSSCVLLSIWFDDDKNEMDSAAIDGLVKMLMKSHESEQSDNNEPKGIDDVDGLAGAKLVSTQKSAIPVESWVMLAKSRSDFIAKRAALTAPTSFLPRLLLCSGLPRASLLTMVDRLGRLGEKAADTNKAFHQLLAPSALSEWDIGRLGHRRDIARKLFGRLSAYSRMYNLLDLIAPDQVSFTFVEWLSDSCQNFQKSTKMKSKKAKVAPAAIFASVESARALFNSLPMDMLHDNDVSTVTQVDADASDMTDFLAFQDKEIISSPERLDDANTIDKFITRIFEENKPDILEKWLDINFSQQPIPMRRKRRYKKGDPPKLSNDELCFLLLQRYILLERKVEGLASALVKWIPKLSASHGSPKFWKTLFTDGQKPSFLWNNLLSRCFQTWNHTHMARCRIWILSEGSKEKLDLLKVVRFLIEASTFSTIHVENFVDLPLAVEDSAWGRTEDTVRSATGFALDCLVAYDYENRLRSRSDPPECLVLLLLIARLGRNQVQFISGAIMKRIQSENEQAKCWLLLCLLRIYAYFPFSMNLGTSALRSNLKEAVEISADDWLFWRSPLDDSVQDMLDTALSNITSVRSVQTLVDISKKHPLLLLRKLDKMGNVLEKDAVAIDSCVKVGVISGESLKGPLRAVINGKMTKLSVKHWGFNYTEHVWSTILDVVAAVPNEVLFGCALKMGLLDLLGIYLRLVLVQSQLRTSSDRLGKLKEKLSEFLGVFKSTNPVAYDSWMASANCDLPSLGATRNVLVGCGFMSHKQAIESVRKAYSSETKGEN